VDRAKIGEGQIKSQSAAMTAKEVAPTNHRQHAQQEREDQVMAINNVNNEDLYN
jgi:hypothetical protein